MPFQYLFESIVCRQCRSSCYHNTLVHLSTLWLCPPAVFPCSSFELFRRFPMPATPLYQLLIWGTCDCLRHVGSWSPPLCGTLVAPLYMGPWSPPHYVGPLSPLLHGPGRLRYMGLWSPQLVAFPTCDLRCLRYMGPSLPLLYGTWSPLLRGTLVAFATWDLGCLRYVESWSSPLRRTYASAAWDLCFIPATSLPRNVMWQASL